PTPIAPINPPESSGGISPPSLPMPDPPTPPSITAPELPALPSLPQPVIAAAAPAAIVVPVLGRLDLPVELTPVVDARQDPLTLPQALGLLFPVSPQHARHDARGAHRPHTGVLGATVTIEPTTRIVTGQPTQDPLPAPRKTASQTAPPWETLPLILDSSFAPAPAGASGGGPGGGSGGRAAALLSLWPLLPLPGCASLRLPARQRRPRGRVDDKQTRPG